MKVSIVTLGCKVNQFESQALEQLLTERGHEIVAEGEAAEVCVVNTCAVTAESVRKSRQAVRRAMTAEPEALIAVCGCWSQISPEEAKALGAQLVGGSGDRRAFVEQMEEAFRTRQTRVVTDEALRRRVFEPLPAGKLHGRTRAMLKVQDGCVNFCTYCVIPYARGPVRSLPLKDAVAEAKRIEAAGIKEIVITGIEIASYGRDLAGETDLAGLTAAVAEAVPGLRLRLGSLEPRVVTKEFCETLKAIPGLCPHFHLSLQSGCDATLRRMRRKYDTARFYESVRLLRETFPGCGLTADLITGFPGEDEEEFAETLAFIRQCAFSSMHVFPYSVRPGTVAAEMPLQVEKAVKKERANRAIAAAAEMRREYLASCVGKRFSVLFETKEKNGSAGYAENYCPVRVEEEGLAGQVLPVRVTNWDENGLFGQIG